MTCEEHQPHLTQYLLGDLPDELTEQVRRHVEDCPVCQAIVQDLKPTLDLLGDALAGTFAPAMRLTPDRREAITNALPGRKRPAWVLRSHPRLAMAASMLVVVTFTVLIVSSLMPASSRARRKALVLNMEAADRARVLEDRVAGDVTWDYSYKSKIASNEDTEFEEVPADIALNVMPPEVKAPDEGELRLGLELGGGVSTYGGGAGGGAGQVSDVTDAPSREITTLDTAGYGVVNVSGTLNGNGVVFGTSAVLGRSADHKRSTVAGSASGKEKGWDADGDESGRRPASDPAPGPAFVNGLTLHALRPAVPVAPSAAPAPVARSAALAPVMGGDSAGTELSVLPDAANAVRGVETAVPSRPVKTQAKPPAGGGKGDKDRDWGELEQSTVTRSPVLKDGDGLLTFSDGSKDVTVSAGAVIRGTEEAKYSELVDTLEQDRQGVRASAKHSGELYEKLATEHEPPPAPSKSVGHGYGYDKYRQDKQAPVRDGQGPAASTSRKPAEVALEAQQEQPSAGERRRKAGAYDDNGRRGRRGEEDDFEIRSSLSRREKKLEEAGTPVLGDIPVVGRLVDTDDRGSGETKEDLSRRVTDNRPTPSDDFYWRDGRDTKLKTRKALSMQRERKRDEVVVESGIANDRRGNQNALTPDNIVVAEAIPASGPKASSPVLSWQGKDLEGKKKPVGASELSKGMFENGDGISKFDEVDEIRSDSFVVDLEGEGIPLDLGELPATSVGLGKGTGKAGGLSDAGKLSPDALNKPQALKSASEFAKGMDEDGDSHSKLYEIESLRTEDETKRIDVESRFAEVSSGDLDKMGLKRNVDRWEIAQEDLGKDSEDKNRDIAEEEQDEERDEKGEKQKVTRPESDGKSHFVAVPFNPFVSAQDQSFSTFSIDVDTAAYTLARNYMRRGFLPPPESVRTEEFINFFDYGYRAPESRTFAVHTTYAPSPHGRGLQLLKIGIKGRRLGREEQRGAVLTVLVDTSGSMDKPDRMGLLQASLKMLVNALGATDEIALLQYDTHARLVLEHTRVSEKGKILAAIDAMQCGGSTNLEEGMLRGYSAAASAFRPGAENRVLLMSDGVANLGSGSSEHILKTVEKYRRQGIQCSVFGFGMGTYDDAMLEALANKGNGNYAFIDTEAEAHRLLVEDLGATLQTIASDVKIQVEFNPHCVKRYRQLGYENRQLDKQDFRNDAVDAGEVGSGQSVTALYEVDVSKVSADEPLATVRVRYRRSDTGQIEEVAHAVGVSSSVRRFRDTDPQFRLAAAVAELAEILRESPHARGSDAADLAPMVRAVAAELPLDSRIAELRTLVEAVPGLSRAGE